jgi:hypothetical protein
MRSRPIAAPFGGPKRTLRWPHRFGTSWTYSPDYFTALSAQLIYYLYRSPRLDIPITYSTQTPLYYRAQTYFSNHGLSLSWRHRPLDNFSYDLGGRANAGIAKNEGLSLTLYEGSGSVSRFARIPSTLSFGYSYSFSTFFNPDRVDIEEQRGTLYALQQFGTGREADFSYTLNQRLFQGRTRVLVQTAQGTVVQVVRSARDNSFTGHQFGLSYRHWLRPDFHLRGSAGIFPQFFIYPDSDFGKKRRNTLYSYGVGAVYQWRPLIRLSLDYQWQKNRSNLESAFFDENDILQQRRSALGDYTKRVIVGEIHVDF